MSNADPRQLPLIPQCGTTGCAEAPVYRFTWPGSKEQLACERCASRAQNVARGLGFELEVKTYFPF